MVSREQIEKALEKKGFKKRESHHRIYYFCYEGKITSIRTKTSRGSSYKDYDDSLLSLIKRQLKFENKNQLMDFINCPFTEEDYIKLLQKQNLL